MTLDEKKILAEIVDMLHKVSASAAALEDAAKSPTLGGKQLTPIQLEDLRQKSGTAQKDTFHSLAERIRALPNT